MDWQFDHDETSWNTFDGDKLLAKISIHNSWPVSLSAVATKQFGVSTDVYIHDDDLKSKDVSHDLQLFLTRLLSLDKRLPQTFEKLFPRDGDGDIDWQSCMFNVPPDHKGNDKGSETQAYLVLGALPCQLECAFCTRSLLEKLDDLAIPEVHLYDLLYQAALWMPVSRAQSQEPKIKTDGTTERFFRLFNVGGDEPTVHPDLPSFFKLAKLRGYAPIRLTSSAVHRLTLENLLRYQRAGLDEIQVPLYGTVAEVHDEVVGVPGHFDLTIEALKNSQELGIKTFVHSVVTTLNAGDVGKLPDMVRNLGAEFLFFNLPVNDGPSRIPVPELTPRLSDLDPRVLANMDGFIPCLNLGKISVGNWHNQRRLLASSHGHENRSQWHYAFGKNCESCAAKPFCSGVFQSYLDIHSDGEFKPISFYGSILATDKPQNPNK